LRRRITRFNERNPGSEHCKQFNLAKLYHYRCGNVYTFG
jgi:hypothetical protein